MSGTRWAAMAVALALGPACVNHTWQPVSSGSLALSNDDVLLYAADTDNGIVAVRERVTGRVVADVKVGLAPVRVLVAPDDTLYVANRGSASVSVIHRGEWTEATRLDVGLEPTGLALSPDGASLYVTSSTARDSVAYGVLTAFDTRSLTQSWEVPIGQEPRAVTVINGGKTALVALYKQGDLAQVDLEKHTVVSGTGLYDAANASRASGSTVAVGPSTFRARAMGDLIAVPDKSRVFAPVVWAREDAIARRPSSFGGYYSSGGPCSVGSVATAGIVTFDTGAEVTPRVDDLTSCAAGTVTSEALDFPVSTLASRAPGAGLADAVQGPTVGVVDQTGSWLYVVNRESKNVAALPVGRRSGEDLDFATSGRSVRNLVPVAAGADGIVLTSDGLNAYVYSQFTHTIQELQPTNNGEQLIPSGHDIKVATDTLAPDLVAGRTLFFDAVDPTISGQTTNVACSTCHLEGRDDGHVWQFPDGPRQTPALAGRQLLATAPYHWSGEFPTLQAFAAHTIVERMGGSGLSDAQATQLDAYVDQLPAAPSPMRAVDAAGVARGQQAFLKAGCDTCHSGAVFTNNKNADVGTLVLGGKNPDNGPVVTMGFNVPSLLGLGRSAPYLHDGSQATLEERVFSTATTHGAVNVLSGDEKRDLVVFLKSL